MQVGTLITALEQHIICPKSRKVIDFWASLPVDDTHKIPLRESFNPSKIPSLLSNISLVEWISEDELLIRLMGTELCDILSADLTGENVFSRLEGDFKNQEKAFFRSIFTTPAIGLVNRLLQNGKGLQFTYTTFYLPLYCQKRNTFQFIGASSSTRVLNIQTDRETAVQWTQQHDTSHEFIDIGHGIP